MFASRLLQLSPVTEAETNFSARKSACVLHQIRAAIVVCTAATLFACTEPSEMELGSIRLFVTTTGEDRAATYSAELGNIGARTVVANGSSEFVEVVAGRYNFALRGQPENCQTSGGNTRNVDVRPGVQTTVAFFVNCTPLIGELTVTTSTSGPPVDTDGFTIAVDEQQVGTIGSNAQARIPGVRRGLRYVRLLGVDPSCAGGGPQSTNVTGGTNTVHFQITCTLTKGSIRIRTLTSGPDQSPVYSLSIASTNHVVPATGSLLVTAVSPGPTNIELKSVPANCVVDGSAQREVNVVVGQIHDVDFAVTCSPVNGSIAVSVVMTGESGDGDGFITYIDEDAYTGGGFAPGETFAFPRVSGGAHSVHLEDVANNCVVAQGWVRNVAVVPGTIVNVVFEVNCFAAGSARVTVVTNGTDIDVNGYTMTIDGLQNVVGYVASNSVSILGQLPAGPRQVRLSSVASNCQIVGSNPVSATIIAGVTLDVFIAVTCVPLPRIEVTTSTSGQFLDPNGYVIRVTGGPHALQAIAGPNGTSIFPGIEFEGNLVVSLTDVAMNCDVAPHRSQTITVGGSGTFSVHFNVTCSTGGTGTIAYSASVNNNWDIYVARSNGSGITRVTSDPGSDTDPAWSRDGRIAFTSSRNGNPDIYVMDSTGANTVRLTNSPAMDGDPSWSPDGSKIVFVSNRDGNQELYVMNSDGTNVTRLTTTSVPEDDPAWSPDGMRIAFTKPVGNHWQVHVMNADGTGATLLRAHAWPQFAPAWSPDGQNIAMEMPDCYYCDGYIYVVRSDGTGELKFIAYGYQPSWSADGSWILSSDPGLQAYSYPEGYATSIIASISIWGAVWRW